MIFPLDKDAELFVWGPIPVRLYYVSEVFEGEFFGYNVAYPWHCWPRSLVLFQDERLVFLMERQAVNDFSRKAFEDFMLSPEKRSEVHDKWKRAARALREKQEVLAKTDIAELSDNDFILTWKNFHEGIIQYWPPATIFEAANFESPEFLKEEIRDRVPEAEINSVLEILTAPEELSFYQQEEIELSESHNVAAHAQKYCWLKNSYARVEDLPVSFFEQRKAELSGSMRAELSGHIEATRKRKSEVVRKYALSPEAISIADAISVAIAWQDQRKREILEYLHWKDVLLQHAAERLGADKEKLLTMFHYEIISLLAGEANADTRSDVFGFVIERDSLSWLDTAHIEPLWGAYLHTSVAEADLRGTVASKGKGVVRGKARIVLDPHAVADFEEGCILVTTMTTPDFVFLMKKASAIVTDTGGLTSHAAIVSRELAVPCIVGTKVATQVFKDGDMVEVDAEKGVVRKI
jgi:phosphohistidine swiveling domain-containing protein